MKILKSLWILLVLFYISFILYALVIQSIEMINGTASFIDLLYVGFVGSNVTFFSFGIIVWPPILLIFLFTEMITLSDDSGFTRVRNVLIIESLVIIIPFIRWAIINNYPMWFYFIGILILGQYLRYKKVCK